VFYYARHIEHPDVTASLLVLGIVIVSLAMVIGSFMIQPLLVGPT
jgi:hypothetical protein